MIAAAFEALGYVVGFGGVSVLFVYVVFGGTAPRKHSRGRL